MQNGQLVKVYPRGQPSKAAAAHIAMISTNQRAIALAFGDKPPFGICPSGAWTLHPAHGIVLLATREDTGACGCWVELFEGGRFEIAEVPVQ